MQTALPLSPLQTTLLPGTKATWRSQHWSFARVCGGLGFLLEGDQPIPLAPGELLVVPAGASVWLQASQLSALALCHFEVCPEELPEFFSVAEQCALAGAARQGHADVQVLAPDTALARQFASVCGLLGRERGETRRAQMLRLAARVLQDSLKALPAPASGETPGQKRFHQVRQ
jgi:hypothetical protein